MNRIWNVLFWSVLSAAFIGPGTVTTASSAGARFGPALLWALAFSTLACVILQEGAARLTAVSGRSLGEAIAHRFGRPVAGIVAFAVVLGCAAYEAGNILGGVAGLELIAPVSTRTGTLLVGAVAGLLLATATTRWVARLLGLLVAVMGAVFFVTALRMDLAWPTLLASTVRPSVPAGSLPLIVGLIGTTVVPYNLFLGSGLARGRDVTSLRQGIAISVILGGLVSMAVLLVGTALEGDLEFARLAQVLEDRAGAGAVVGFGLFAAGLSSAITAPLAAALTVTSVLARTSARAHRAAWAGVLMVGLAFGLSGVRPVPMILLAQLFNGLLLPLVAGFLLMSLNDPAVMPTHRNGALANLTGAGVWLVSLLLGTSSLLRGASSALGQTPPATPTILVVSGVLSLLAGTLALGWVRARRR